MTDDKVIRAIVAVASIALSGILFTVLYCYVAVAKKHVPALPFWSILGLSLASLLTGIYLVVSKI